MYLQRPVTRRIVELAIHMLPVQRNRIVGKGQNDGGVADVAAIISTLLRQRNTPRLHVVQICTDAGAV